MNRARIMLFAYDGTGLGHLMRLIKIASGLSKNNSVLLVSGHTALPDLVKPGMDFVLLPNFYDERDKGRSDLEIYEEKVRLIGEIVQTYRPNALIVDYLPLGKRMELYSVIVNYPCKKYIIIRSEIGGDFLAHNDVFSERNNWFLENYFSRIFIASDTSITDPSSFYWLSDTIRSKMIYSGFVSFAVSTDEVRETRCKYKGDFAKWVVCSNGGGRKGMGLIKACMKLAQEKMYENIQFDIILGYYSPLINNYPNIIKRNIRIHKWSNILYKLHASADYVICSGAYNSLIESMQGKKKTIFSMSVFDEKESNEQSQNIEKLSQYYDIRRIFCSEDIEYLFAQRDAKPIYYLDKFLNMDGLNNICKIIESDLQ